MGRAGACRRRRLRSSAFRKRPSWAAAGPRLPQRQSSRDRRGGPPSQRHPADSQAAAAPKPQAPAARPPAELLLMAPGLLQLPAREALRVHLARALAGAHELVAAVLGRIVQADPALLVVALGLRATPKERVRGRARPRSSAARSGRRAHVRRAAWPLGELQGRGGCRPAGAWQRSRGSAPGHSAAQRGAAHCTCGRARLAEASAAVCPRPNPIRPIHCPAPYLAFKGPLVGPAERGTGKLQAPCPQRCVREGAWAAKHHIAAY